MIAVQILPFAGMSFAPYSDEPTALVANYADWRDR